MKSISQWASKHRSYARWLVFAIKVVLAIMAFYTGLSLSHLDIHLPASNIYLVIAVVFIVAFYYPSKETSSFSKDQLYVRRKASDFLLGLCAFFSIATGINNLDTVQSPVSRSYASLTLKNSNHPTAAEILASLSYRDKKDLSHQEKRILKKEFNKQGKVYVKSKIAGDSDKAGKALLVILTIIGALGLLVLLASLVCSLSCAGSDAAAILVALLGLAGIIWATVAVIKAIKRGSKKKKEPEHAPSQ